LYNVQYLSFLDLCHLPLRRAGQDHCRQAFLAGRESAWSLVSWGPDKWHFATEKAT